ncbi:MAG: hypothetical protein H3C68_03115 [Deltaproteobacteria bacterium]|nr:hypothetical protein [Deltaproteobacteria bacterium]MBZ0219716.1 hypothetical protein [Deltaproteobacteria bacterium]
MKPEQVNYPIFKPNQVLSNKHLNQLFSYLDEQGRLTRANLIGIGIVCGLEISCEIENGEGIIHLSRGIGITSEGYLIMEPDDVSLVSRRPYELQPGEEDYSLFEKAKKLNEQIYELFPESVPDTSSLKGDLLQDKILLLFYEMKNEERRNCSLNSCDDRGTEVRTVLRRLLVSKAVIESINAEIEKARAARLKLPDIRLPRFDLPQDPDSVAIYTAFLNVLRFKKFAKTVCDTLRDTYNAFKPFLEKVYDKNPFANLNFNIFDTGPMTADQVRFLQYYYDLFDDLIRAYDEFRWKGSDLICACAPPEALFRRHLAIGMLDTKNAKQSGVCRNNLIPSPAIGGYAEKSNEALQLFRRLVEMTASFTNTPLLPEPSPSSAEIDKQIRITPSRSGDVALADRAIPYYYNQNGKPPLHDLWNPERTRRGRSSQNLSYQSGKYGQSTEEFVKDPLLYDLESYNFLRIEGHLGKNYQDVLNTLLAMRSDYRLPIGLIALPSGNETYRYEDLEERYNVLRTWMLGEIRKVVATLYEVKINDSSLTAGTAKFPLFESSSTYRYGQGTVGAWYEKNLDYLEALPYTEIADTDKLEKAYSSLLKDTTPKLEPKYYVHVILIHHFTRVAEALPDGLNSLDFNDFALKYRDMLELIRFLRGNALEKRKEFKPQKDLIDHISEIFSSFKLETVQALSSEYAQLMSETRKKMSFGAFLRENPGIQHKAGVPLGGTFIIVYHSSSKNAVPKNNAKHRILNNHSSEPETRSAVLSEVIIKKIRERFGNFNPDELQSRVAAIIEETYPTISDITLPPIAASKVTDDDDIKAAVNGLKEGTVIADFFLPYIVSNFQTDRDVLPEAKPS